MSRTCPDMVEARSRPSPLRGVRGVRTAVSPPAGAAAGEPFDCPSTSMVPSRGQKRADSGYTDAHLGQRRSLIAAPNCALRSWRDRRSEEHTSELQSLTNLVCRLLLEKKKKKIKINKKIIANN